MALQSVTSSGRQPSWSRSVGSAPDFSSSSTMSKNSQAAAGGRKGRVSLGILTRGSGDGCFLERCCSWQLSMSVPEARNAISAPGQAEQNIFWGSVRYSIYYLPLDLTVQRKEKRQSESNEKPEVLRGCYWCNHSPRVRAVWRASPRMMHRVPACSLSNAPSHPGLETDPGKGYCSTTESPKVPPGKAFPACFCTQN